MKKYFLFALFLLVSSIALADSELATRMQAGQLEQKLSSLGNLMVEGVGEVSFSAQRQGAHQILVYATTAEGKALGRAEATVGVSETPIYILTPNGLSKVTIKWGANEYKQKGTP